MADLNELFENGGGLLTFNTGGETYGFYILDVMDIIEIPTLTKIPTAPPYVLGLMNHRGKAVPVMDLRLRIGLEKAEYDERSCVIVTEINTQQCGIVVDRVSDVETVAAADVVRSPIPGGIVTGFVVRKGREKISIVDPERVVRKK